MSGGYLSPREGPVDLLQLPKWTIMFGYRFQNSLLAPEPWTGDLFAVSDLNPADRQRVGIFKTKAYLDEPEMKNTTIEDFQSPTG